MYILYLDESGFHTEARYFVLAGIAVFEREIHWISQDVDLLQTRFFPDIELPVEFHSSPLHVSDDKKAKEPFNQLTYEQRKQLSNNIYQIIRSRNRITIFGVAIEKAWCKQEEPYSRAFEDLTSRFDLYLSRINKQNPENEQRGLIAVAESSYRRNLEILGERFRGGSTRWGQIHNICDVPFFMPAKNNRTLQLADFCANAIYGRYNSGLTRYFDIIAPRFDRYQGRIHGLNHLTNDYQCQCMACFGRQQQVSFNLNE